MIQCPAVQDHIEFIIKCMKKNQWMDEHFWFLAVNLQKLLAVGMYIVHRELPEKDLTERNLIVTFRVTFMEVCLIVDVVQTRRMRLIEQSAAES